MAAHLISVGSVVNRESTSTVTSSPSGTAVSAGRSV